MMTIEFSERAASRISEMTSHVEDVSHHYGAESTVAATMATSLTRAIGQTFSLLAEGGSLSTDGERGLYIITSYGMHVGVVFFRDRSYDKAMVDQTSARVCIAHRGPWSDAEAPTCDADANGVDNVFCMQRVVMVPGSWSLHS